MKARREAIVRLAAMIALLAGSVTLADPGEPEAREDRSPQQVRAPSQVVRAAHLSSLPNGAVTLPKRLIKRCVCASGAALVCECSGRASGATCWCRC